MRWSGYGLIIYIIDFSNSYNIVGVVTANGYWKGLYSKKFGNLSIFTQAMCFWEGKNYDDIGYWDFNKMMHLPYTLEIIQPTDKENYLSYLACLYIAYIANQTFPQRVPCQDNFDMMLSVKQLLSEYRWKEAWAVFEAHLAAYSCECINKSFFQTTHSLINEQYQISIMHPFRRELLKHISDIE